MKKISVITLVLLFPLIVFSQRFDTQRLFDDSFETNNSGWSVTTLKKNGYETFLSKDERYICNLPINNSMGWNWTWVGLPDKLSETIDENENVEMKFDWEVLKYNGYFRFGLMFDTHNITNQCPGGDFRVIWVTGNNNGIDSKFMQTKDCNSGTEWEILGKKVTYNNSTNHFKLIKNKYTWNLFINEINVLSFEFKGSLNIDKLNFGMGSYAFDNFTIDKKVFSPNTVTTNTTSYPISNKPRIFILLAGIEKYTTQIPLNYTVDDIASMYNFWISPNGGKVDKSQIIYLPDNFATTQNILQYGTSLFSKANENDVIITFLSGHGGEGNFCTYDGSLQYENLNQVIKNSKAKLKLCIIDACHAGSLNTKGILTEKGNKMNENDAINLFYQELQKSGDGICYLLACKANENSMERSNLGHGVFTYFLLEGLMGNANSDNNSFITIKEIYDYLNSHVPLQNSKQHTEIKGTFNPDLPLAIKY